VQNLALIVDPRHIGHALVSKRLNEATYRKSKTFFESADDWRMSSQICYSSVQSALRNRSYKIRWLKNGRRKCVKSSITHPRNARFCRNLVRWCIVGLVIKAENDWRDRRPQVAMHN